MDGLEWKTLLKFRGLGVPLFLETPKWKMDYLKMYFCISYLSLSTSLSRFWHVVTWSLPPFQVTKSHALQVCRERHLSIYLCGPGFIGTIRTSRVSISYSLLDGRNQNYNHLQFSGKGKVPCYLLPWRFPSWYDGTWLLVSVCEFLVLMGGNICAQLWKIWQHHTFLNGHQSLCLKNKLKQDGNFVSFQ